MQLIALTDNCPPNTLNFKCLCDSESNAAITAGNYGYFVFYPAHY